MSDQNQIGEKAYLSLPETADYFNLSKGYVYREWPKWTDAVKILRVGRRKAIRLNRLDLEKHFRL